MRKVIAAGLAFVLATGVVRAEGAFTGSDAAFIDWAVKNCGMKSTDAEHRLVDGATAKGQDAFSRQYMQQFESALFKEAAGNREKQNRLCRDLKEWYGKEGTRFQKLLVGDGDSASAPAGSPSQAPRMPTPGNDTKTPNLGRRH